MPGRPGLHQRLLPRLPLHLAAASGQRQGKPSVARRSLDGQTAVLVRVALLRRRQAGERTVKAAGLARRRRTRDIAGYGAFSIAIKVDADLVAEDVGPAVAGWWAGNENAAPCWYTRAVAVTAAVTAEAGPRRVGGTAPGSRDGADAPPLLTRQTVGLGCRAAIQGRAALLAHPRAPLLPARAGGLPFLPFFRRLRLASISLDGGVSNPPRARAPWSRVTPRTPRHDMLDTYLHLGMAAPGTA